MCSYLRGPYVSVSVCTNFEGMSCISVCTSASQVPAGWHKFKEARYVIIYESNHVYRTGVSPCVHKFKSSSGPSQVQAEVVQFEREDTYVRERERERERERDRTTAAVTTRRERERERERESVSKLRTECTDW